jgi:hypothetical protein
LGRQNAIAAENWRSHEAFKRPVNDPDHPEHDETLCGWVATSTPPRSIPEP